MTLLKGMARQLWPELRENPARMAEAERRLHDALRTLAHTALPDQILNEGAMAVNLEGSQRHKAYQAFARILLTIAREWRETGANVS